MNRSSLDTKDLCNLGIGIALYVALSATIKIPLIGHIQTDFGYIVFGLYCMTYGPYGAIVGACGCLLVSLIFSGWFPPGWIIGQIYIGIVSGLYFKLIVKNPYKKYHIAYISIVSIMCIFVGIGVLKTLIECALYSIPIKIKFFKNMIAVAADIPPMILGAIIGERIRKQV